MSERSYIHNCPVCCSSLDVSLDTMTEEIKIRPENLPPLAKDLVSVVAAYKRLKGLGPSWESKHMARGLIYAGELLNAVGVQGGAVERATGLLQWLSDNKREFDLGSAASFFGEYSAWLVAKNNLERSRCTLCGESFAGSGSLCPRHA